MPIDDFNLEQDCAAAAAAKWLGLGDALYKDLAVGDRFHFRNDPTVMVKGRRGFTELGQKQTYRTGQRTAVFRIR